MGYVQQNLNPGERILYQTHLHWIVLFRAIFVDTLFSAAGIALIVWGVTGKHDEGGGKFLGIVGLTIIILGNIILALAVVRRNATEMAVTNKRVIIKVGYLTKHTVELFLSKVESVGVEQTFLGSMMGFGSITVRGTGGTNEPFSHVSNPLEFRHQVQRQTEEQLNPSPEA